MVGKIWREFLFRKGDNRPEERNALIIFNENGTFKWGTDEGTYTIQGNHVTIRKRTNPGNPYTFSFVEHNIGHLTLTQNVIGGDYVYYCSYVPKNL
jgi:hypothetical protein